MYLHLDNYLVTVFVIMGNRIEWVDVYKGVLIILVVVGHSLQEVYSANKMDFTTDWFRNIIYSFHMPAFMAISGYLVFSLNKNRKIFGIIKRRFKQLIIPLLIWTIVIACVKNTGYIGLLLYPNNGYWFLWTLFFIIVIFNIVSIICSKIHVRQEIGMFLMVLILMILQIIIPNPKYLGYEYIAYYFPFYIMGYFANKYKTMLPKSLILVCVLFIFWFILACFWTPNDLPFFLEPLHYIPTKILQLSYRILVPIIFVIAMFILASRLKNYKNHVWYAFKYVGEISMGIYLVHMAIKRYITKWILNTFDSWSISWYITVEFTILIVSSILIVSLLQKWKHSNKWLLGNF